MGEEIKKLIASDRRDCIKFYIVMTIAFSAILFMWGAGIYRCFTEYTVEAQSTAAYNAYLPYPVDGTRGRVIRIHGYTPPSAEKPYWFLKGENADYYISGNVIIKDRR